MCTLYVALFSASLLSSVEKYLPGSKEWLPVTAMSEKRINPGTCEVHGFLYAAGGHNGVAYLSSVERYHPHTNQWTRITSMAQPRTGKYAENMISG